MVELKVQCPCGTKFVFDVEPVDGRIPEAIACPACGRDATDLANEAIQPQLASASVPVAAAPSGLRLTVQRPEPHAAPPPPPAAPIGTFPASTKAAKPAQMPEYSGLNIKLGVIGALIGGAIGMAVWYGMIRFLNIEFGWIAWGVGALAGAGAKIMGREGSPVLAAVACVVALVAILGGEALGVKHAAAKQIEKLFSGLYEMEAADAKEIPADPTDKDLKEFLAKEAKEEAEPGEEPAGVTDEAVKEFREERLGRLMDIASGKLTKAAYQKQMAGELMDSFSYTEILRDSISVWTALWLFLGLGSAWKIASGEG